MKYGTMLRFILTKPQKIMKTTLLSLPTIWQDFSIAAGIVGISALLGFYAHQFAGLMQASLFGDWGFL